MVMELSMLMDNIPIELKYKIMKYSYNFQSCDLLNDIESFNITKDIVFEEYKRRSMYSVNVLYNMNKFVYGEWIINDIFWYMNDYQPLMTGVGDKLCEIVSRSYIYKNISNDEEIVIKIINRMDRWNYKKVFNYFWGLFKIDEREEFIDELFNNSNKYIGSY